MIELPTYQLNYFKSSSTCYNSYSLTSCTIVVSQWAVFTIRVLTEQNPENQEVISQMERQGVADTAMLDSMGLRVEERNGKLYVKSQEKCE